MACLFCKIANKEIDSNIVYEDDHIIGFHDINPQSPVHLLLIPKKHISTINEVEIEDTALVGHMVHIAKQLAAENNIAESGYRLVFNVNPAGGQEVYHIHLHILGGRQMSWPPG